MDILSHTDAQTFRQMALTLADLYNAHDDDKDEGQQFPSREHVLYACGPAHARTVHPRQQH